MHQRLSLVSRSSGRSATAAAAYRCGLKIKDERTETTSDYRRRSGVETHFTMLPPLAFGAKKLKTPSLLWNAAELAEKRSNSCTARELVLAIPHELSAAQRFELLREISEQLVSRYKVGLTCAIHAPDEKGDQRNWHAHILMTTRRIDEKTGLLGVGPTLVSPAAISITAAPIWRSCRDQSGHMG